MATTTTNPRTAADYEDWADYSDPKVAKWLSWAARHGIVTENGCEAMFWHPDGGSAIVRKTVDGQFAVIRLNGGRWRVLKKLPTLDRARAYLAAVCR